MLKIHPAIIKRDTETKNIVSTLDLTNLTVATEGSSKIVHPIGSNLCAIKLKPTLYSFTHNRYGVVPGTDIWRYKLWKLFAEVIDSLYLDCLDGTSDAPVHLQTLALEHASSVGTDRTNPSLNTFRTLIETVNGPIAICKYIPLENQTPLEVVWKEYFLGTMKHNLLFVDQYPTLDGSKIDIEGKLPNEIIRFDWRNPFEYAGQRYKDEAICDDFAAFWINVPNAKRLGLLVSGFIKYFLGLAGYTFVDTCYFIDKFGAQVFSEITPDGMRIKKNNESFDKDLWRVGKDSEILNKTWGDLFTDLTSHINYN